MFVCCRHALFTAHRRVSNAVKDVSLTLPARVALIASHRRQVFNECDDPLLKYLDDDGQSIEPQWYVLGTRVCVAVCTRDTCLTTGRASSPSGMY